VNIIDFDKKVGAFWDKTLTKHKEILATLPKNEDLTNVDLTRVERDNLK
jgi:hypothetical protein